MKRLKNIGKSTLLIIYEKKIIQYILIATIIFLPVTSIISNKFSNKINTIEESGTSSNKDTATKGSIKQMWQKIQMKKKQKCHLILR